MFLEGFPQTFFLKKPFVRMIQLVLSPRISFVILMGHVGCSTRTVHLETKETHSCTSTNPIRTLEKVLPRDQITFPLLDWKLLGCVALHLLQRMATDCILWSKFDDEV